jgi:hypothetical protein
MMLFSSAAISLGRLHITRVTIGGGHSHFPLLFAPSNCISLGERRRFAEMVARKKSTTTLVGAPSGGSGRTRSDLSVVIGTVAVVTAFFFGFFGFYSAIKSEIKDVKSDVTKMINSKLDAQDRKLDGQDRKVDGIEKNVDLLPLKFELKKYWNWFGLSASPVMSEDENVSDIVSKVSKNLDAKVADALEAVLKELKAKNGDQERVNDDNSSNK